MKAFNALIFVLLVAQVAVAAPPTPNYDKLGREERAAIDWDAYKYFADAFNILTPVNGRIPFNSPFVARITGRTDVELMAAIHLSQKQYRENVIGQIHARIEKNFKPNPEFTEEKNEAVKQIHKNRAADEYTHTKSYDLIEATAVQDYVNNLPINRDRYEQWRAEFIEPIASSTTRLERAVKRLQLSQNAEYEAKRLAGNNPKKPVAIELQHDDQLITPDGRMRGYFSSRAVNEIENYALVTREGCEWKSGIYFRQSNPTASLECIPTGIK